MEDEGTWRSLARPINVRFILLAVSLKTVARANGLPQVIWALNFFPQRLLLPGGYLEVSIKPDAPFQGEVGVRAGWKYEHIDFFLFITKAVELKSVYRLSCCSWFTCRCWVLHAELILHAGWKVCDLIFWASLWGTDCERWLDRFSLWQEGDRNKKRGKADIYTAGKKNKPDEPICFCLLLDFIDMKYR